MGDCEGTLTRGTNICSFGLALSCGPVAAAYGSSSLLVALSDVPISRLPTANGGTAVGDGRKSVVLHYGGLLNRRGRASQGVRICLSDSSLLAGDGAVLGNTRSGNMKFVLRDGNSPIALLGVAGDDGKCAGLGRITTGSGLASAAISVPVATDCCICSAGGIGSNTLRTATLVGIGCSWWRTEQTDNWWWGVAEYLRFPLVVEKLFLTVVGGLAIMNFGSFAINITSRRMHTARVNPIHPNVEHKRIARLPLLGIMLVNAMRF